MRIACVFVPQLALQAVLRRTPEARGGPVAVLEAAGAGGDGAGKTRTKRIARVTEISPEARREGVRAGMTGAQAAAVCSGLRLLTVTAADREAASAALADVGYAFAPRIERDGGDRIFFESEDLARLYPAGETAIAQAVQAASARVGLGVRVAVAASKGVARLATRAHEQALVPTAAGPARAALASIPVEVLCEGDAPLAAAFRRWGLRTAGDVAALSESAVGLRLGPTGARASRLARGIDDEPFVPRLPDDALEEAIELDYPVAELEPFAFMLRGLIDRALGRLRERSLACAGLTLRLTLDPRGADVRSVPIAAPTGDAATLLQLARLDLARRPPAAPIVGARLLALPARVRPTQLDMLRPAGPAPDRLAATIARLAALVGPDNVGAPAIEDTWREEAVGMTTYEPARPDDRPAPRPARPGETGGPLTLTLSPLRGARANSRVDASVAGEGSAPRPAWRGEADGRRPAGEGNGGATDGGPLTLTLSPLRGARANSRVDASVAGEGSAPRPAWRGEADGRRPAGEGNGGATDGGPLTLTLSPLRGARANGNGGSGSAGETGAANETGSAGETGAANETGETSEPRLTIRRRRTPEEIEMLLNRQGPAAFRGRETTARVLVAAGPYRLSGEWWKEETASEETGELGWSRAYWDVHASDGAVYRVHQDRRSGRWYLDGYYD
jgi:protein ImuB